MATRLRSEHKARRDARHDISEEMELLARDQYEAMAIEELYSTWEIDRMMRDDWASEAAEWAAELAYQDDLWGPMGSPAHQHDLMQDSYERFSTTEDFRHGSPLRG